jgi:hypothetical protein
LTTRDVVPAEPENSPSPEYVPETASLPAGAAELLHAPLPFDKVAVQSGVDPVTNVTEPPGVGKPAPLVVTVAK